MKPIGGFEGVRGDALTVLSGMNEVAY